MSRTRQCTARFIDQPMPLIFNFSTPDELVATLSADKDFIRAAHVSIEIRDVEVAAARPDWLPPDHREPLF